MKKDTLHHKTSFKLLYYRYKDTPYFALSIFVVTITVCLLLLFKVVFPQVSQWFSIQQEIAQTKQNIRTIQKNTTLLKSVSDSELSEQLQAVVSAYPFQKDFVGIVSAISAASAKSATAVEDYAFDIGDVSASSSAEIAPVAVALTVQGTFENIKRFVQALSSTLPLSQVTSVAYADQHAVIEVRFFYKPFAQISYNDTELLKPVSNAESAFIGSLSDNIGSEQLNREVPLP